MNDKMLARIKQLL